MIHCLIDQTNAMKADEFKKFWEMIPKANETQITITALYSAFTQSGDSMQNLIDGLKNNGIVNLAKVPKKDTNQTMLYFGAKTINNLPLLFEVAYPNNTNGESVQILFKVPVLPLKPLLEESIRFIFSRKEE
jgi:hypothetical protein